MTPNADWLPIIMAEFIGLTAAADIRRADTVLSNARAALPGLDGSRTSVWNVPRPSMPDLLPTLDCSARHENVYLGYRHDHPGPAAGPMTGQLIAQFAARRSAEPDLSPYLAERFA